MVKALKLVKDFLPDIVFGFNKMPGLDLYFAADTCFAKQSLKKNPLQKFTRRHRQSMEFESEVFSRDSNTKILLLNEIQAQDFQNVYSTQQERLTLIPPGIERDWNQQEFIDIAKLLNLPANEKIILFVGSDFSRKGLDRAIIGISHLLKQNISATLLVLGDDHKGPYEKAIKDLSLSNRIIFLGPRKDVASFMKSSHLLVHPAREEAAGNIIIEAMVSGLPSLVSKEVGFSDEVKKFKIGYIEKNPNFFEKLKKDHSEQTLLETGLFYLDEKKKIYVERFRGRLIFPINNISGQPIALGGRIIENLDYLAKYINSPETNFFKKGSNLYNLDSVSYTHLTLPTKA